MKKNILLFVFLITFNVFSQDNIPNVDLKTMEGKTISFHEVTDQNNVVIISLWATWCVPCREEHPLLMKLNKNQSIKLIGLNYRDNLSNAKNFINEFGNPYSQIIIDDDGTLSVEFGAYGVPETFIIDKNKQIIRKFIGPINKDIIEEIKSIIK